LGFTAYIANNIGIEKKTFSPNQTPMSKKMSFKSGSPSSKKITMHTNNYESTGHLMST